jgi:hypothetical protein
MQVEITKQVAEFQETVKGWKLSSGFYRYRKYKVKK